MKGMRTDRKSLPLHRLKSIQYSFGEITSIALSPSNKLMAIARKYKYEEPVGEDVIEVENSRNDGVRVGGDIEIWDPLTMCHIRTIHEAGNYIRSMCFVDEDYLLVGALDGELQNFFIFIFLILCLNTIFYYSFIIPL